MALEASRQHSPTGIWERTSISVLRGFPDPRPSEDLSVEHHLDQRVLKIPFSLIDVTATV